MKKIALTFTTIILVLAIATPVLAKSRNYFYRKRANWVKLTKLSNKQMAGQTLSHPYTTLNSEQMIAMLESLEMSKGQVFSKKKKEANIFSPVEARRFGPYIVQALQGAGPNEVVNVAIVHRRPFYVIRNDFISILNVFATDDGVHFYFSKLYAKLTGDYQQASNIDKAIRNAKSIRKGLTAREGQILVPGGDEIILDPNYNYAMNTAAPAPADPTINTATPTAATPKQAKTQPASTKTTTVMTPEPVPATGLTTIKTRLSTLEDLKKADLISEAEYNKKRKEILKDL